VTNSSCGTSFTIEPGGEAILFQYNNQPFADGDGEISGYFNPVVCDITVRKTPINLLLPVI